MNDLLKQVNNSYYEPIMISIQGFNNNPFTEVYLKEFDQQWTEDPTDSNYLVNRIRGAKSMTLRLTADEKISKAQITIAEDNWLLDQTTFQFVMCLLLVYLLFLIRKLCKSGFWKFTCLRKCKCFVKRRENYAEQEYRVFFMNMQFK